MSPVEVSGEKEREPRRPRSLLSVAPRLAPGSSLIREADGAMHLQLASGACVRLNTNAATLFAYCDGSTPIEVLARRVGGEDDTRSFLAVALDLGWLVAR